MNDSDTLQAIKEIVAEYILDNDKPAIDSMEEIIDLLLNEHRL